MKWPSVSLWLMFMNFFYFLKTVFSIEARIPGHIYWSSPQALSESLPWASFSPALLLPLSLVHSFVSYRDPVFLSTHSAVPPVLRGEITSHSYCCYWVLHYYGMFPTFSIPLPCLNAFVYLFLNSEKLQWVSLKTERGYIIVRRKKNIHKVWLSPSIQQIFPPQFDFFF